MEQANAKLGSIFIVAMLYRFSAPVVVKHFAAKPD